MEDFWFPFLFEASFVERSKGRRKEFPKPLRASYILDALLAAQIPIMNRTKSQPPEKFSVYRETGT